MSKMKIDVPNIRLVKNPESARKAYASVVIDDSIVLNDIAIVQSKDGALFASMPQRSYESGGETKYANIYNPITKEARDDLVAAVLGAYEKALEDADEA